MGLQIHHIRSVDMPETVGLKTHPTPQTRETCAKLKVNKNAYSSNINGLAVVSRVKPSLVSHAFRNLDEMLQRRRLHLRVFRQIIPDPQTNPFMGERLLQPLIRFLIGKRPALQR